MINSFLALGIRIWFRVFPVDNRRCWPPLPSPKPKHQTHNLFFPILTTTYKQKIPRPNPLTLKVVYIDKRISHFIGNLLTYDPAVALRKVTCPVLALNVSKDLQVSPQQNLPPIRRALEEGGNKHFEVVELPGLNHLLQTAGTGAPAEYAGIEETISPIALQKIASWIKTVT